MHRFHSHLPGVLCLLSLPVKEQSGLHAAVSVHGVFDLAVHGHAAAGVAGALSEPCSCGDVHLLQGREEVGGGLRGPVVLRLRHLPLPLPRRQQLGWEDAVQVPADHAERADAVDGCDHLGDVHLLCLCLREDVACGGQTAVPSELSPEVLRSVWGDLLHLPVGDGGLQTKSTQHQSGFCCDIGLHGVLGPVQLCEAFALSLSLGPHQDLCGRHAGLHRGGQLLHESHYLCLAEAGFPKGLCQGVHVSAVTSLCGISSVWLVA